MSHHNQNQLRRSCGIPKHTLRLLQRVSGLIAVFLAATLHGQDPLELLPEAYKLEFENDWERLCGSTMPPRRAFQSMTIRS